MAAPGNSSVASRGLALEHGDGTLETAAFAAGLRRWAGTTEVRRAWEEHGASDAWAWDWRVVEPAGAGGGQAVPYAVLRLTRTHAAGSSESLWDAASTGLLLLASTDDDADDPCALPAETTAAADDSEALLPGTDAATVIDWEFHVLYNDIYRVPCLWLAAAWADGAPLTDAELAAALPAPPDLAYGPPDGGQEQGAAAAAAAAASPIQPRTDGLSQGPSGTAVSTGQRVERWTVLSQDEHPVLGRPWHWLHPCGTAGRMRHLVGHWQQEPKEEDESSVGLAYLVKWFGLVCPVLGLPYPAAFGRAVLAGEERR